MSTLHIHTHTGSASGLIVAAQPYVLTAGVWTADGAAITLAEIGATGLYAGEWDKPADFEGVLVVLENGVEVDAAAATPAYADLHHSAHVVVDRTAGELRVYDADPATGGVLLYTRDISETATTSTIGVPT